MIFLLFLVVPVIILILLFIINKLATTHWERNNPDFTIDDMQEFIQENGAYRNPKDFRIIIKEGTNFQTKINLGNPILILLMFILMLSFPIVNQMIMEYLHGQ
jgi:uncharacterized membrane protein